MSTRHCQQWSLNNHYCWKISVKNEKKMENVNEKKLRGIRKDFRTATTEIVQDEKQPLNTCWFKERKNQRKETGSRCADN